MILISWLAQFTTFNSVTVFKSGALVSGRHMPGFLKLFLCRHLCFPAPKAMITNGVIWHDIKPIWLVIQALQVYMAAIVNVVSRCGLTIEVCCRDQPNNSKLVLCKPWIHFYNHLIQLYLSNKMEHFSFKGGCGVHGFTHIKVFNRRAAGLGCR